MPLAYLLMSIHPAIAPAAIPPRPDLYICLSSEALERLRVRPTETCQILVEADKLLREVETSVPSIGVRPELRAHLTANAGKLIGLVQDGTDYLFRFVQ